MPREVAPAPAAVLRPAKQAGLPGSYSFCFCSQIQDLPHLSTVWVTLTVPPFFPFVFNPSCCFPWKSSGQVFLRRKVSGPPSSIWFL